MKRWFGVSFVLVCSLIIGLVLPTSAQALDSPIVDGCQTNALPAADDVSSAPIDLTSPIRIGSKSFSQAWVNNNGNVTLDGPTIAYVPFGLEGTYRAIIAPFFADVDTTTTSPVTWAQVSFEGRPALCVNWLDVGYSLMGSDKHNSFQLLLVDRTDVARGAFDIVFNYQRLQWDSGDYAGGEHGLGGAGATVGFSNGSGKYFEMVGSRTPNSFLDSEFQSLTARTNADLPGRWLWRVREGMGQTNYVAMGDSFQSGEGAYDYAPGTDQQNNECHRSRNAYPQRIAAPDGSHYLGMPVNLTFVACSGARMAQMTDKNARNGEPAQLDALGPDTALVTVGIGGNDLEFADALGKCVKTTVVGTLLTPVVSKLASCQTLLQGQVEDLTASMASGTLGQRLDTVYQQIRTRAPQAKVLVVTYPEFFTQAKPWPLGAGGCSGVRRGDAIWLNNAVAEVDAIFANHAYKNGFQVADVQHAFGQENGLCSDEEAMNGIVAWDSWNHKKPGAGSFHPNSLGHSKFADTIRPLVAMALGIGTRTRSLLSSTSGANGGWPTETIAIAQGDVVTRQRKVGGKDFAVNVMWGDATITTRVKSPDGTWHSARHPRGADHMSARGYERFTIADPEPGVWTVEMTGVKTFPSDRRVELATSELRRANRDPIADAEVGVDDAGAVTFDSSGSSDPERAALTTLWDFGDGAEATGTRVSHVFAPGTYFPTVVIHDDADNASVEPLNVVVEQVAGAKPVLTFLTPKGRPIRVLDPGNPHAQPPRRVARPADVRVQQKGRRLLVSWTPVAGAEAYVIRASTRYPSEVAPVPDVEVSITDSAVIRLDRRPRSYRVCVEAGAVTSTSRPTCVARR